MNMHLPTVLVTQAYFDELPETSKTVVGWKWKQSYPYGRPSWYWMLCEYVPNMRISTELEIHRQIIQICPQRIKI